MEHSIIPATTKSATVQDMKTYKLDTESGEYIKMPSDRTYLIATLYFGYVQAYPDKRRPDAIKALAAEMGLSYSTIEVELTLWNKTAARIGQSIQNWRNLTTGLIPVSVANLFRAIATDTPRGTAAAIATLKGLNVFTDKIETTDTNADTTPELIDKVFNLIMATPALKAQALQRLTESEATQAVAVQGDTDTVSDVSDTTIVHEAEVVPEPIPVATHVADKDGVGRGVFHQDEPEQREDSQRAQTDSEHTASNETPTPSDDDVGG